MLSRRILRWRLAPPFPRPLPPFPRPTTTSSAQRCTKKFRDQISSYGGTITIEWDERMDAYQTWWNKTPRDENLLVEKCRMCVWQTSNKVGVLRFIVEKQRVGPLLWLLQLHPKICTSSWIFYAIQEFRNRGIKWFRKTRDWENCSIGWQGMWRYVTAARFPGLGLSFDQITGLIFASSR